MLGRHSNTILNEIRAQQPDLVKDFALEVTGDVLAAEDFQLAKFLQPEQGCSISDVLEQFSLERIMSEAEVIVPSLCKLLRCVTTRDNPKENAAPRKDKSLISLSTLSIISPVALAVQSALIPSGQCPGVQSVQQHTIPPFPQCQSDSIFYGQ
ncbi:hypothetical protein FIBSPDRAFT_892436 [Athelia psychrophila]|uniref:Uncharacterized protein n=1 Tax=Athelia psychrophila TaxID=1759441 RepID=A0A166IIH7_9AGAM|nr:hypothetical protein FIBSPDRAFT_892436 [Fibularhizoctonia sp. CBS 109695]